MDSSMVNKKPSLTTMNLRPHNSDGSEVGSITVRLGGWGGLEMTQIVGFEVARFFREQ